MYDVTSQFCLKIFQKLFGNFFIWNKKKSSRPTFKTNREQIIVRKNGDNDKNILMTTKSKPAVKKSCTYIFQKRIRRKASIGGLHINIIHIECLVFVENWLCMWNSDIQIEGKISLWSRQNVLHLKER